MALIVPHGMAQVKSTYGDFSYHELSGGNVDIDDVWERDNLILVKNICGTGLNIQLHKLIIPEFTVALAEAMAAAPGYKIRMLGGHCGRHMMHDSSKPLSIHSWGAAFDLNWDKNLVVSANAPLSVKSAGCDMPKSLVDAFKKRGWNWGGDWLSVKDYMHFQYATGC